MAGFLGYNDGLLRNNARLLENNDGLLGNNGREMEDKKFSSISKPTLNKGVSRVLWKMEENMQLRSSY
ncbi:MAG: hypothetical protein II806_00125 [Bacteroidaceae bacterium]|nr:hypothetical protein [Bacteroidaceae bacterium]